MTFEEEERHAVSRDSERYNQAVADLVEAFTYEDCHECMRGIEAHVISPDMFGHPHAWCRGQV